jgi:hypothetical protein
MLRIPREGDDSGPLMAPLQKVGFAEEQEDSRGEKRTRSKLKRKAKEAEVQGWEASSGKWRASRKKGKRLFGTIAFWVISIGIIFGVAFMLVKKSEKKGIDPVVGGEDTRDESVHVPLLLPEEDMEAGVVLPKVMMRTEVGFIESAQPIARKFLAATEVSQIFDLVSDGARVKSKILDYYPNGKITPTGLSKFNSSGNVSYKDSFAAVSILTTDFEQKQLAFIDGEDGLKIDWESWVGWSELPWDKLLEIRPDKPILVRVMLKWVDYYNFGFSDENKWRSYRLLSPEGEHMLYGYAERNSLLDQRMRPGEQKATVAVTLKIHFPDGESTGKQVIIDEYIADGWVVLPEVK